jgi:xanthine dehydrogenase molybdopterin-binding subunit B
MTSRCWPTGEVHYVGQPVFLVVADSHLAARKAARLAQGRLRRAPALLTIEDALAATAGSRTARASGPRRRRRPPSPPRPM